MIRTIMLAAVSLCVARFALAQTYPTRPDHAVATSVHLPVTVSKTIACSARLSYRVSIVDGHCGTFSNPDSDGNPTPPDYVSCTNAAGDSAIASCYRGCHAPTGSGRCVVIRDHR